MYHNVLEKSNIQSKIITQGFVQGRLLSHEKSSLICLLMTCHFPRGPVGGCWAFVNPRLAGRASFPSDSSLVQPGARQDELW